MIKNFENKIEKMQESINKDLKAAMKLKDTYSLEGNLWPT